MPRRKPASVGPGHLRRAVAALAARMMAEEGIGDYGAAKRKAARRLGAAEGEALPANEEVEAELRAWQSLYQDEEQRERVRELRATAVEVMQALEDFRPYLTGGALDGTAGRYASVEIDLFADSSKDVEIALLSRGIAYEALEARRPGVEAVLRIDWNDIPVYVSIYPVIAERQSGTGHAHGRARARTATVLDLLKETAP